MNKAEFISELQSRINYTQEQCVIINDVLEDHYVFRKKNKPKIIADLTDKLSISEEQADYVYEQAMEVIHSQIKKAKRHPFGSSSKQ